MSIRVRLTDADLSTVRLRPRPRPVEGVATAARQIARRGWSSTAADVGTVQTARLVERVRLDAERARLAVELLSLAGRPSFVDCREETIDGAIERLMAATRQEMTTSLRILTMLVALQQRVGRCGSMGRVGSEGLPVAVGADLVDAGEVGSQAACGAEPALFGDAVEGVVGGFE
jgi:hypothetical protein